MKKIISMIACAFMLALLSFGAFAYSREAHGWYCMRNGSSPPEIENQFSYIESYNGFFLDRKATDEDKVIYLTFDAGYENGNIEKVLDALKKHNAKGAFFVLDNLIKTNPDLVKRMANDGNLVCNHTASHKDMTKITDIGAFEEELKKLEDVYREYTGLEMAKFYRPPEGKFSEENMYFADSLGYKTVFWSFAYADWDNDKQPDPASSKKKILDNTHNGMVILLHPTSATNAAILDELLTQWEKQGYRFGDLNELCEK